MNVIQDVWHCLDDWARCKQSSLPGFNGFKLLLEGCANSARWLSHLNQE
jgi:hypothetical protein